jgi:hypothetical protein
MAEELLIGLTVRRGHFWLWLRACALAFTLMLLAFWFWLGRLQRLGCYLRAVPFTLQNRKDSTLTVQFRCALCR